ncbi:MAG: phage protease [Terriglobia bacterium]
MAGQDYAKVSGQQVHKSDFGYAPGDEPSKWKFPLHDKDHVDSAMKMFAQAKNIPAAAMVALRRKILAGARRYRLDTRHFEERHGSPKGSEHAIPVLLSGLGSAAARPSGVTLHRSDARLFEIPIAITGSWVKGDYAFSITDHDLSNVIRNFDKRKNDMVVIDYEHASETPEVARGGPIPAAGWIHGLRESVNGVHQLRALVEWTPEAEQMIGDGQYRFFSPAIDWGATDKETGEPQGATLTSGALTNHPFLEELPPIMLSDGTILALESDRPVHSARKAPPGTKEGEEFMAKLKKMKLQPIPEGEELAGHHAVIEEGNKEPAGYVPDEDLVEYSARHLGINPDEKAELDQKQLSKDTQRHAFFLREAVRSGRVDNLRASELAMQGKISLAEYIKAQEAERLLDSAVQAGKILPRDRAFFFSDALERPREFAEYVKNAVPVVTLGSTGFGSSQPVSVDEEISLGVKRLMSEDRSLRYPQALKRLLKENPDLERRYHGQHLKPAPVEASVR